MIRGMSIVLSSLYEEEQFIPYAITFGLFRAETEKTRHIFKFHKADIYLLDIVDFPIETAKLLGSIKNTCRTDPSFWEILPSYQEFLFIQKNAVQTISKQTIIECLQDFLSLLKGYIVGHCFFSYIIPTFKKLGLDLPQNIFDSIHDTAVHEFVKTTGGSYESSHYDLIRSQEIILQGCSLQDSCSYRGIALDGVWTNPIARCKAVSELATLQFLEKFNGDL